MGREAVSLGATTFQFFTRNPRGTSAKAHNPEDAAALATFMRDHGFGPVVAHAPYVLNPASSKPEIRALAVEIMVDDLGRLDSLPGNYYNMHPGSHGGQGLEHGVTLVAEALDKAGVGDMRTTVLLETMSGTGSEIGGKFEELAMIIDAASCGHALGVCLDTCHVWAAGHDIASDLDGVLGEFDRTIGLGRLKAVHLNDSVHGLGSRKDRHAKIGEGAIGLRALENIINHPALRALPFCLETPNDAAGYAREIALLRASRHAPQ